MSLDPASQTPRSLTRRPWAAARTCKALFVYEAKPERTPTSPPLTRCHTGLSASPLLLCYPHPTWDPASPPTARSVRSRRTRRAQTWFIAHPRPLSPPVPPSSLAARPPTPHGSPAGGRAGGGGAFLAPPDIGGPGGFPTGGFPTAPRPAARCVGARVRVPAAAVKLRAVHLRLDGSLIFITVSYPTVRVGRSSPPSHPRASGLLPALGHHEQSRGARSLTGFVWTEVFRSVEQTPGNSAAGPCGKTVPGLVGDRQTAFRGGCTGSVPTGPEGAPCPVLRGRG